MLARLLRRVRDTGGAVLSGLRQRMLAATRPATTVPLARALADLQRSRAELVAENALLRQQLLILRRSIKRPRCHPSDRVLLMLLASRVRAWRQALFIVQPDTLLRWHRQLFRAFWRRQSQAMPRARRTKVSEEMIALIQEMAAANRLWGAERIRGELLNLDIRVAKWTVPQYMCDARPPQFDLGHVQPAAVLGRGMALEPVGAALGFGRRERGGERGRGTRVQGDHDEHDPRRPAGSVGRRAGYSPRGRPPFASRTRRSPGAGGSTAASATASARFFQDSPHGRG
jgi:hypothetical protein